MIIKHNALTYHAHDVSAAIYWIIGKELFQINQVADALKKVWRQKNAAVDNEVKILTVEKDSDWCEVELEANNYCLFANQILLDVRCSKKTLDSVGKDFFKRYILAPNNSCLLIVRAPHLNLKALQSLSTQKNIVLINTCYPAKTTISSWLKKEFKQKFNCSDPQVIERVERYTEGNLLALNQFIDKLYLLYDDTQGLSLTAVNEQLFEQFEYSIYELAEACLGANATKARSILKNAEFNKTEPTLVLWVLAQEIRILMQLSQLLKHSENFNEIAAELKIWSSKIALYKQALCRYRYEDLVVLLKFCNRLDTLIKTRGKKHLWNLFEQIACSLCVGKLVGFFE